MQLFFPSDSCTSACPILLQQETSHMMGSLSKQEKDLHDLHSPPHSLNRILALMSQLTKKYQYINYCNMFVHIRLNVMLFSTKYVT